MKIFNHITHKNNYSIIDYTKLTCALLVVYIHTNCHDLGYWGEWFDHVITVIAVPFFFIASGFFFRRGLERKNYSKDYFMHYIRRLIYMYLFWFIATSPIAWMNLEIVHGTEYSTPWICIFMLRQLFITGSMAFWYILALIYSIIILYVCYRKDKIKWLMVVATFLFIIGTFFSEDTYTKYLLYHWMHVIFGSERSFLNVGIFYTTIGWLFASGNKVPSKPICIIGLIASICLHSMIWETSPSHFAHAFSAIFLFAFVVQGQNKKETSNIMAVSCRKLSTIIYLANFPFILLFDYYLRRGTLIDYPAAVVFCILLYFVLKFILPTRFLKTVYG